ncbi:hypothetical protein CCP4SC76_7270003 [Gammaproteobacteria bacterium]
MINVSDILWSTRGFEWGFRLLHTPNQKCSDWLEVRNSVFGFSTDDEHFFAKGEVLLTPYKRQRYVALRFLDPELRCDSAGRVIPHEIIVFDCSAQEIVDFENGKQMLWLLLAKAYADNYREQPKKVSVVAEDGSLCKNDIDKIESDATTLDQSSSTISGSALLFYFAIALFGIALFGATGFIYYKNKSNATFTYAQVDPHRMTIGEDQSPSQPIHLNLADRPVNPMVAPCPNCALKGTHQDGPVVPVNAQSGTP